MVNWVTLDLFRIFKSCVLILDGGVTCVYVCNAFLIILLCTSHVCAVCNTTAVLCSLEYDCFFLYVSYVDQLEQ